MVEDTEPATMQVLVSWAGCNLAVLMGVAENPVQHPCPSMCDKLVHPNKGSRFLSGNVIVAWNHPVIPGGCRLHHSAAGLLN